MSWDPANGFNSGTDIAMEMDTSRMDDAELSRLKRTACILCRKRKLKCDGSKPKCQTCNRLGHDCKYDEMRKKSGPKRGYVKALEARLAQVETQLKTSSDSTEPSKAHPSNKATIAPNTNGAAQATMMDSGFMTGFDDQSGYSNLGMDNSMFNLTGVPGGAPLNQFSNQFMDGLTIDDPMAWDIISLGLEEPLPTDDVIQELNEIYFNKVHPSMPMINRARYYSNMLLAPKARPPVCLRYAMWALAAGLEDKYFSLQEHFYRRARKYLELDEMRTFGEGMITIYHCQTWVLVNTHEFKNMHFPRAWLSTGRATRLSQMMGLHRVDGQGLDVKQCLPPAQDWAETEERRRTFWMCFWGDRCASIGTGWPMSMDEQDIMTNLPASEEAYQNGIPETTSSMAHAMDSHAGNLSGFGATTLLIALFGRNLIHLHRPTPDDREDDLSGAFWGRHRKMDNILSTIHLSLASNLRIPFGLPDPNIIFLNMCIHTAVICLHQAAIFKADKYRMAAHVSQESKVRCLTAAGEIAGIMRSVAHLDLSTMNPFMAFCLYVGARVFVQYLKARRHDQHIQGSLDFVLRAMHVMKGKNGLTESFIAQLDLDMESAGIPNPNYDGSLDAMVKKGVPVFPRSNKAPLPSNGNLTQTAEWEGHNSSFSGSPESQDALRSTVQQRRSTSNWEEGIPNSSIGILEPDAAFQTSLASTDSHSPQTVSDSTTDNQNSPAMFDTVEPVSRQSSSSAPALHNFWAPKDMRQSVQPQSQQQQQSAYSRNPIPPSNSGTTSSCGNSSSHISAANNSGLNPPMNTNYSGSNATANGVPVFGTLHLNSGSIFAGTQSQNNTQKQNNTHSNNNISNNSINNINEFLEPLNDPTTNAENWDWNSLGMDTPDPDGASSGAFGPTGLTPGPSSGLSPGPHGLTPSLDGQADWNQIFAGMTGWEEVGLRGEQWGQKSGGGGGSR